MLFWKMPNLFGPDQKQLFPIIPTKPCPKRWPFQKWNWISKTCFGNSEVLDVNLFLNPITKNVISQLVILQNSLCSWFEFLCNCSKNLHYSHLRGVGSTVNLGGHRDTKYHTLQIYTVKNGTKCKSYKYLR